MFNCLKGIDGISNTDIDILNYLHEIITTDTICLLFDDIDDSILPEDELTILRTLSTTDYHEESKRYVQYFNYSIYNVIINKLFLLFRFVVKLVVRAKGAKKKKLDFFFV